MKIEIFFCNKTYNEKWLKDKEQGNTHQHAVINAIIEVIKLNHGRQITQQEVFEYDPRVKDYVERRRYKIIPSGGQELQGGGKGIRHAKYAPSKSVAILWEKIRDTIYITFDDHAPVKYHRAIYSFHKLRMGRQPLPMKSRSSRRTLEALNSGTPWIYKGVDLRKLGYFYPKRKRERSYSLASDILNILPHQ